MVKDHRLVTVRSRQGTVTHRRLVTVRRHQSTVTTRPLVTGRRRRPGYGAALLRTAAAPPRGSCLTVGTGHGPLLVRSTDRLPVPPPTGYGPPPQSNYARRQIVDYVRLHHRSKRPCKLRADQMQRCFALVCLSEIGTLSSASPRTAPSCRSLARSTFKARMRSDLSRLEARRRTCLRGVLSLLLRHRRGTNRNPASEKARPVQVRLPADTSEAFRES
jgi:hypothetical protein